MFKTGVKPAWEDEVNANGSQYKFDIFKQIPVERVQAVWQQCIFDMVTGNMPHIIDGVAGVRLVQKVKNQSLSNFRIELWMTKRDESNPIVKALKQYLVDELISGNFGESAKNISIRYDAKDLGSH